MNRKKYFIISISILFLLALINIPALNAVTYERDWNVGTVLEYTINSGRRTDDEAINDTHYLNFELELHASRKMNITEIDELNKEVIVEETFVGSSPGVTVMDFNATNSGIELADDLFYFYYYWSHNLNRAILTHFDFGFYSYIPFILEPNWAIFNEKFVEVLDENQTIAAIDTGYEIQYILLSDFLEKVTFNINGKDNLVEAKNSFTSDTSKWTFVFELSDYILYSDYDYVEDIHVYFEYDKYEVKCEIEYTKGGILSKMSITKSTSITRDNVRYINEEYYSIVSGDKRTASISYNLLSALIVLVLLPMLLPIRKKRKFN